MTKKKSSVVYWNHLQYIDQMRAMDKIAELIEQQSDETVRVALTAALMELEMWSNTPCEVLNDLVGHEEPTDADGNPIKKTYIH